MNSAAKKEPPMPADIPKRPCGEWSMRKFWAVIVDGLECTHADTTFDSESEAIGRAQVINDCAKDYKVSIRARVVRVELREVGGAA
jgi:hypothetical protein